jgi:hypothetical protein
VEANRRYKESASKSEHLEEAENGIDCVFTTAQGEPRSLDVADTHLLTSMVELDTRFF